MKTGMMTGRTQSPGKTGKSKQSRQINRNDENGVRTTARRENGWIEPAIVFIFLNSLGFPGNFTLVFGEFLGTVIDYACFLLMIAIMLITSAEHVEDIVILELKEKYRSIYLNAGVILICSVIGTRGSPAELITCIRLGVTVLFTLWLGERYSIRELLEKVYISQVIFIVMNLVFVTVFSRFVYRESASYANDFVGLYSAKNGIGSELAFGILVQLLLWKEYDDAGQKIRASFICVLGVQLVMMLLTHNWGSFLCLGAAVIYLMMKPGNGTRHRLPAGWIFVGGSVLFLAVALTVMPIFKPFFDAIGKDATLTGRIPLWEQALKVLKGDRLITGYGYGMFWRDPEAVALIHRGFDEYSFMANMVAGSHNQLIELLLNTGIAGIAAYFIAMLDSMKHIYELSESQYRLCSCYIIFFTIYCFTERAAGTHEFLTLFTYYILGVACNREDTVQENVHLTEITRLVHSREGAGSCR